MFKGFGKALREQALGLPVEQRRRVRETAGMSLAEVATTVGADPGDVARWEAGDVPTGNAGKAYNKLLYRLRLRQQS